MKPDSMLVEPEFIVAARQQVAAQGVVESLEAFSQTEPALAAFIGESLAAVAGKLALSGAPTPVVQGSNEEVLAVALTCIAAVRRGHYELWKDGIAGTPLERFDLSMQGKSQRRRRRKKGEARNGEGAQI